MERNSYRDGYGGGKASQLGATKLRGRLKQGLRKASLPSESSYNINLFDATSFPASGCLYVAVNGQVKPLRKRKEPHDFLFRSHIRSRDLLEAFEIAY